jgi:2-polyprenyl-6-methoxyphenol hydroxylase-like FAD-dependent oxidoreductase
MKSVIIIGAGPVGLSMACSLASNHHNITEIKVIDSKIKMN